MSTFELNKIVGAILLAALVATVIGMIGDGLVHQRGPAGPQVATGGAPAKAPASRPKEADKAAPIAPLMAKASAEKGKAAIAPCKACHTFEKGGKNGVGPNLWNVVMQNKANNPNFSYSSALKEKQGPWTYEELSAFIEKPQQFAKGTKMTFAGILQAEKRADIIAYLRSLSDNPAPLPQAGAAQGDGAQGGGQGGAAKGGGAPKGGGGQGGGAPKGGG